MSVKIETGADELAVGGGDPPGLSLAAAELDDQARLDADTRVEAADLDAGLGLAVADERAEVGAAERPERGDEVEGLEDVGLAGAVVTVQHGDARAEVDFARAQVAKLADAEVLELQIRSASA